MWGGVHITLCSFAAKCDNQEAAKVHKSSLIKAMQLMVSAVNKKLQGRKPEFKAKFYFSKHHGKMLHIYDDEGVLEEIAAVAR